MNKEYLINIYNNTKEIAKNYPIDKSYEYIIQHIKEYPENKTHNNIFIKNLDMIEFIKIHQNEKCCILNMASCYKPGGGVESGCSAQEEVLFRRSNYVLTLHKKFYPIDNKIIYSPLITFFKDSNYNIVDKFSCSAIACSSIKNPFLVNNKYLEKDKKIIDEKINKIFCVAIENKIEILILSAFGCGAYHNPPEEVAEIMYKYSNKYSGYFKRIYIAIIDNKYTNNYNIFKNIFKI
jgi:uncharacterized protein (TIGR02452 family)